MQMLQVITYSATSFSFQYLEKTTDYLSDGNESSGTPTFARFVAGAMSGATATTLTYPLDLLRARFAAGVETHKKAAIEDLVEIMKTRGVRGLASGLTPTLLGIMPYAGISFATFETLKAASIKIKHHKHQEQQQTDGNEVKTSDSSSHEELNDAIIVWRFCRFVSADVHIPVRYRSSTGTSSRASEWNILRRRCAHAHR